jgi:hypothetical protein
MQNENFLESLDFGFSLDFFAFPPTFDDFLDVSLILFRLRIFFTYFQCNEMENIEDLR